MVDAFTRLAEATGDGSWIEHASDVADTMLDHFWDVDNGGLFTTADDAEQLVVRQKDLMDNATPSANSTAAVALIRLGALTGEARYRNHAEQILRLLAKVIPQAPTAFSNALVAVDLVDSGITEIAVVGDRPDLVRALQIAVAAQRGARMGHSRTSRRCGTTAATASPTSARTTPARLPADSVDDLLAQLTIA